MESQKETAVSREIMPADASSPAQRNERGFRHVPPKGGRPSDESAAYLSPTGVAKSKGWCHFSNAAGEVDVIRSDRLTDLPCWSMSASLQKRTFCCE